MKIRKRVPRVSEPDIISYTYNHDKVEAKWAQVVGDIYRSNMEQRKYSDENWSKSKEMKHAASIPLLEYIKLEAMGITKDHKAYMRAIEAHPEWKVTDKKLI